MTASRERIEALLAAHPRTDKERAAHDRWLAAREDALSWGHVSPDDPTQRRQCEAAWARYRQLGAPK